MRFITPARVPYGQIDRADTQRKRSSSFYEKIYNITWRIYGNELLIPSTIIMT